MQRGSRSPLVAYCTPARRGSSGSSERRRRHAPDTSGRKRMRPVRPRRRAGRRPPVRLSRVTKSRQTLTSVQKSSSTVRWCLAAAGSSASSARLLAPYRSRVVGSGSRSGRPTTVAASSSVPAATLGSPRSTLTMVGCDTPTRSASSSTVQPRRNPRGADGRRHDVECFGGCRRCYSPRHG